MNRILDSKRGKTAVSLGTGPRGLCLRVTDENRRNLVHYFDGLPKSFAWSLQEVHSRQSAKVWFPDNGSGLAGFKALFMAGRNEYHIEFYSYISGKRALFCDHVLKASECEDKFLGGIYDHFVEEDEL